MSRETAIRRYLKAAASASARERPATSTCLEPEKLFAFYGGGLDDAAMEAVRAHLGDCSDCVELAGDVRRFLESTGEAPRETRLQELAVPVSGSRRPRTRMLYALAALLLIVVGLTLSSGIFHRNFVRDLQIPRAEVPAALELTWRNEAAVPFRQAIKSYLEDDYARAEQLFAVALESEPENVDAHFYRGVSLLLLGKFQNAETTLSAVVESSSDPLRSEARYYRALARLKTHEAARAIEDLDAVIASNSGHKRDAEILREKAMAAGEH